MTYFHVHLVGANGGTLGTDFDEVSRQLGQIKRLHLELDGAFVWVGDGWQLDGMLYDRENHLRYVDVKGVCPLWVWHRLSKTCIEPTLASGLVLRLPAGGLYDLQTFERMTWS